MSCPREENEGMMTELVNGGAMAKMKGGDGWRCQGPRWERRREREGSGRVDGGGVEMWVWVGGVSGKGNQERERKARIGTSIANRSLF